MGTQLNGRGICPDNQPIQIIDIHMIPDADKDTVTEDNLIDRLQSCVPEILSKHDVRVWNMSLGLNMNSEDTQFSSLAIFLDKLQDEYGIIITLPSGNYEDEDQRTWPPQTTIGNKDRLQIPGDSVRAITVGAIACRERPDSIVKINQPTSYSCRGPGPAYIVKPEIVHYSGNLSLDDDGLIDYSNQGILSFDEKGDITEGIGTSYACPLGARILSLVHNSLIDSTSNEMIKALVIHSSYIPEGLGKPEEVFPYVGFGLPSKVDEILTCKKSEITLMFEQEIYEKHILEYPFVWPNSLRDQENRCRGDVRVTLVAGVPLDANYGSEYVRDNVSVSLQSGSLNSKGQKKYKNRINEEPDSSVLSEYYESELVAHGYKWKPIKRYEKQINNAKADDWRIRVRLLLRDGMNLGMNPIKFALIFTLSDPAGIASVYDEVVVGLRSKNVITNPIQLRSQVQERIKT